jgi:hypothetical protein
MRGAWHRWGAGALMAVALLVAIAVAEGPLVGIAMIFFTSLPLGLVNIFGSIIFALAVPWLVRPRRPRTGLITEGRDGGSRWGLQGRALQARRRTRCLGTVL